MEIEARTLERLQNYKIGPKLLFYTSDYFVYEFIDGIFIKDYIEKNKKPKIQKVLIHVFNQCFQLDNLGINKEEMHHPYKHVLITKKDKVFLIDFERSVVTQKPHNVTQFCQCIMQMKPELEKKGFDINKRAIIKAAKEYKDNISLKKFKRILELID